VAEGRSLRLSQTLRRKQIEQKVDGVINSEVEVINPLGIHARPSAKLTQVATRFKAEIWLSKGARKVNAKSIMGVMMLAAAKGAKLTVQADGIDEEQAIEALKALFADGFGEL
jgi:phosphocarrier protein HPr